MNIKQLSRPLLFNKSSLSPLLVLTTVIFIASTCNSFNLGRKLHVERNRIIGKNANNHLPSESANEFGNKIWEVPKHAADNERKEVFVLRRGQTLKRTLFTKNRKLCKNNEGHNIDYYDDDYGIHSYSYRYDDDSIKSASEGDHLRKDVKDSRDRGNIDDEHSHKCERTSSVSCDVSEEVLSKSTELTVSFQYCVEAKNKKGVPDIVAQLESAMLTTLSEGDVLTCPDHRSLFKASELNSSEGHGRKLEYANIIKISSDPKDTKSKDGKCEPKHKKNKAVKVDGTFTVYYKSKGEEDASKKSQERKVLHEVLAIIEEACDEDTWVNISDNLVRVKYLGSNMMTGRSSEKHATDSVKVFSSSAGEAASSNAKFPIMLAAGGGLLASIILAALLAREMKQRKNANEVNNVENLKDIDDGATDIME
eukprot:CAMPEP_0195530210 /NCGR_PEP_ID=MMETSP0794_2-20130614/33044_1 /TAXON_ID=515487 /ORGANISM="Stephanopyxis turris, Strain CCMP 815" /LENGTH=422 /DNA_ID=CAMNT_0040661673 /DNA_START=42 /DNA_END=1310 /DNA_ORIENTATION=+